MHARLDAATTLRPRLCDESCTHAKVAQLLWPVRVLHQDVGSRSLHLLHDAGLPVGRLRLARWPLRTLSELQV